VPNIFVLSDAATCGNHSVGCNFQFCILDGFLCLIIYHSTTLLPLQVQPDSYQAKNKEQENSASQLPALTPRNSLEGSGVDCVIFYNFSCLSLSFGCFCGAASLFPLINKLSASSPSRFKSQKQKLRISNRG